MKRILRKLGLLIPSILLVAATITTITLGNRKVEEKENFPPEPIQTSMTVSGYLGSIDVVYVDENFNAVTEITTQTKIWVLVFLTTTTQVVNPDLESGIDGYELHWDFDPSQVDESQSWALTGIKSDFEDNTGYAISDIPGKSGAEYAQAPAGKGKKTNFKSGVTAQYAANELLFTGTTGGDIGANVSGKEVLIGAMELYFVSGVTEFSATCTLFYPGNGGDNPNKTAQYVKPSTLNFGIGAGVASDSTVVTGTIQGASETAARNVTVNANTRTIEATVPACATNGTTATLSLAVDQNGTFDNDLSGTGFTGSAGNYTVSFDNRGQTRTGTVTARAADGEATKSYTINVTWEQYDNRQLKGMSITSNQSSAYGVKFTQNNGSNSGDTVNIPVTISSATTSVKFTPTIEDNQGISVSVDGKPFSGTGIDVNVSNGTTVPVVVTSEKGSTKTYNYTFTTVASDTTIKSISLTSNTGNLSNTPTYNNTSGKWEVTIPFTNGTATNSIITINPTLKSGNTYSPNPLKVTFADTETSETSKTVTVTVKDTATGETQPWDIVVTRKAADLDEGIDATSVQVATDAAFTNLLPVSYDATQKLYTIDGLNPIDYSYQQLYLKVNKSSTTSVLYYANEASAWNGTTARSFSTGSSTATTDFQTTFRVKAVDASTPTTYTVKGKRGPGDTNNALTIVVTGAGNNSTINPYTPTNPQADHSYYMVKESENQKVRFTFTKASDKAKLEFSTDGNTYQTWTTAFESNEYAIDTIYYAKVTSQTNASKVYYLHIEKADERDATVTLDELYISYVDASGNTVTPTEDTGKTFSKNTPAKYTYTVPYNAGEITITYTPTNSNAHVYQSKDPKASNTAVKSINTSSITGSRTLNYWVQAENETWSNAAYQVEIIRTPGSTNALLDDLVVNGTTVEGFNATDQGGNYTVLLPTGKTSVTLGFDPIQFATATYNGNTVVGPNSYVGSLSLPNGKAEATITVKSQTGSVTNKFTVTVYSADQGHVLSALRVLDRDNSNITTNASGETVGNPKVDLVDADGNKVYTAGINPADPTNIEVNVPASVSKVFVYATTNSTNAKIEGCQTVTLNALSTNGNPSKTYHTVTITSEYGVLNPSATGQTAEYSFVFIREGYDTENRLHSFDATTDADDTNMKVSFNQDNNTITITDVDPAAATLNITVTKESSKSDVKIHNAGKNVLSTTVTIAWPDQTSGIFSFPITVTSEAGVDNTYTVKVSREDIKLNDICTIESITITGMVGTKAEDHSPSMTATFPYKKDIDGNTSTLLVSAKLAAAATGATLKIEYQNPGDTAWKTYTTNINPVATGVTKIKVSSKPEDQTKEGKEYIIELNKVELSDDATVDKVTIGGTDFPQPKPTSDNTAKPTEVPMDPGTTGTTIKPFPHDPEATVTVSPGPGSGITANPNPSDPDQFDIGGLQPGPNKVIIKVTPEDPTAPAEEYEVIIHVDEDTSLFDLSVTNHTFKDTFDPTDYNYELNEKIAYTGEDTVDVNFTLPTTVDHTLVKVSVDGKTISTLTQDASGAWGATVTVPSKSSRTIPVVISQNTATNKGTSTTYNIKIEKDGAKTGKDLLDISVAGQKIPGYAVGTTTYVIVAPRDTKSIVFSDLKVSDGASYTTSGTNLNSPLVLATAPGIHHFKVSVYSEADTNKQTPNIYTFYIICAENDEKINKIELVDVNGNPIKDVDGNPYTYNATEQNPIIKVPSNVTSVYFKITRTGGNAYSSVDGTEVTNASDLFDMVLRNNLVEGPNTSEVFVMSELKYLLDHYNGVSLPAPALFLNGDTAVKESNHYNFTIDRKKISNDASILDMDAYLGNNTATAELLNFADPKTDYIIENVGTTGNIGVYIKLNDSDAKILTPAATPATGYTGGTGYYYYNWVLQGDANNNYLFTLDIKIEAADGTTKNYKIEASRSTIDKENDNKLIDIIVTHQKKPNDNLISFAEDTLTYDVKIDDTGVNGVKHYTISAKNILGSLGKIYIDDVQEASHTFNITDDMWGQTITHKVYAYSQNGDKGKEYIIKVEIEAPSDDNELDTLKIDGGENLIGTHDFAANGPYTMDVKNEKTSINLSALTSDEKASIEVILQDGSSKKGTNTINVPIDLVEGPNVMTVEVTAESGQKKRYQITVNRALPMPKLLNLGVNGETLLDTQNAKVEFDPETFEYNVCVIYSHDTAEIFAASSSPSDHIYGTGTKPLQVGLNPYSVTVQNDSGNATEYKLNIYRYSKATMNCDVSPDAKIFKTFGGKKDNQVEIEEFAKEFSPSKYLGYQYTVSNKYDEVVVDFKPIQGAVPEFGLPGAKVEVFGAENLHFGLNNIVVVVTAPDGVTQQMYYIGINKLPMDYDVNNKQYPNYTIEADEKEEHVYKVNIGDTKTVDVDFTKFVEDLLPAEDSNMQVSVVSDLEDNPNEVILRVTDGNRTDIIKLKVESTGNPSKVSAVGLLPLWIGLGIIILLLTTILICVNKDKFGKITKKSEKKNDKKDKKEAANR